MKEEYKIGKALDVKEPITATRGKYTTILEEAIKAKGKWIPVVCEDKASIGRLQMAVLVQRKYLISTRRDTEKLTLFIKYLGLKKWVRDEG